MSIFKTKIVHLMVIFIASVVGFVSMSVANAATDASKSASCETLNVVADGNAGCDDGSASERVGNVIQDVVQVISIIAGVVGVIMLMVGGLKYVTSSGDSNAIASAKRTIIYAVVGLVIAAFAQILVQFVLSRANSSTNPTEISQLQEEADRAEGELARSEKRLEEASESDYKKWEAEYTNALKNYEQAVVKLESAESKSSASGGTKNSSGTKKFKVFKVATFNVLGYGHTAPGGKKASWPDGDVRFDKAMQDLKSKNVSVAALQEMHSQNQKRFHAKFDDTWGSAEGAQDFVIWRKDQWRKIEVRKITIPYFIGENRSQPFVLLEQRSTGKRIWFMGIHNPANVSGQVADRRKRALEIERDAIQKAKGSGHPIFIAGDFNDGGDGKISAQCMLTPLMSNVFGNNGPGPCGKPRRGAFIDHIFFIDASALRVSGAAVDDSYKDRQISDHPMVTAIMSPK